MKDTVPAIWESLLRNESVSLRIYDKQYYIDALREDNSYLNAHYYEVIQGHLVLSWTQLGQQVLYKCWREPVVVMMMILLLPLSTYLYPIWCRAWLNSLSSSTPLLSRSKPSNIPFHC